MYFDTNLVGTLLTPAPRTLVQIGSCRRCSLIHPLHVVVDVARWRVETPEVAVTPDPRLRHRLLRSVRRVPRSVLRTVPLRIRLCFPPRPLLRRLRLQQRDLLHASGWEPLLVARLEEERGHTAEAREAYEQAGTAADVRRILRKQAEWEEAAALDGDNADLEWLLKVDRLAAARPAGLGARLYEQEHRRLTEALAKMRDDDRAGA